MSLSPETLENNTLDIPASFQLVEGYPPEWLKLRASQYWFRERTMAFENSPILNGSFFEMSPPKQLAYILNNESLGIFYGDYGMESDMDWRAVKVKFPYGNAHLMAVPNYTDPFIHTIQDDYGAPDLWNKKLHKLLMHGSALFQTTQNPFARESVIGINSGKNQTRPFLHVHFADFLIDDWHPIAYSEIPNIIPHRQSLLQKNNGFTTAASHASRDLIKQYPSIIRPSFIMTNGGSVFMDLADQAAQIVKKPEFVTFLRDVDSRMLAAHKEANIEENKQCMAMVIGQMNETGNGFFAFQLAVKIGNDPSGVLETINHSFELPSDYKGMTNAGAINSEKYIQYTEGLCRRICL